MCARACTHHVLQAKSFPRGTLGRLRLPQVRTPQLHKRCSQCSRAVLNGLQRIRSKSRSQRPRSDQLHTLRISSCPALRTYQLGTANTWRYQQCSCMSLRHILCKYRRQQPHSSLHCMALLSHYHCTSGPLDTPRTADSTTGSAHASRTLSKCRTGARHGTRDRSCPSARHTCTGPAGTPPDAWSSHGPMRPLALPIPTRQTGTP